MKIVQNGSYKHYKGNMYRVLHIGHHSETLEEMVVYQAMYESQDFGHDSIWVRPAKMFLESVTVNGATVPRFEFVS